MTVGYLLDNNAVFRWQCGQPNIAARIKCLPEQSPFHASVITLGEIRFGHSLTITTNLQQREDFERWFRNQFPYPLSPTRHTAEIYGDVRAELFRKFPPQGRHENHPEMCYDDVTAKVLGIDENDLWVAAQAIENALTLVGNDKMRRIKTAAGTALNVEDWENWPI